MQIGNNTSRFLQESEPTFYKESELKPGQMLINIGPQHPSTHGVLRLEVLLEGEVVIDVIPHVGYLHRCFEKHAEKLPFNQTIPFTDRLDYLAAMNNELAWAIGVEQMMGITDVPKRVEYIRVLMAELNRIASHFIAIGTYGIDIGAFTPFLWLMQDREHLQRLLEWVSGARMLYNYIWVGGLFYDLPIGFEDKCLEFCRYLAPRLEECNRILLESKIFKQRTANVGVLPLEMALDYGVTGPMLRASGLAYDLRRVDGYSVYPELDFDIPIGKGEAGTLGDCWDRTWVRLQECRESLKIAIQCLHQLTGKYKRTTDFNPQEFVPKKIRPSAQELYARAENPKGELGFYFIADGKSDVPFRVKARGPSFVNLAVLPEISKGGYIADLVACIGSLDLVMGEVDR
jgi:NADH-quinone oxidoreductase subunit D